MIPPKFFWLQVCLLVVGLGCFALSPSIITGVNLAIIGACTLFTWSLM